MTQNPTVIAASLDDEALRSSVDALVSYVDKAVTDMSTSFNDAVGSMEKSLKKLGNIKVTSGGANDGGTSTSTKKQEELAKAAKETAISFDAEAQSIENLNKVSENSPKFEQDTLGALREQIAELQETLNLRKLESEELRSQVDLLRQRKNEEKNYLTSRPQKELSDVLRLTKGKPKGLDEAEIKLQKLVSLQEKYRGTTKLSEAEQTRLTNAIERARQEVEKIKNSRPKSLKEVLGMDENSVEAITIKLRELKRVKIGPENSEEAKKLADNYTRLQEKQRSLLGQNALLAKSNNVLASSFGYIRNRIIYALTLGTLGSFVRNVREVRAEYEMLERSLGILVGSMEQGTEIFKELSEMALKSPFTLVELGTAAKQLTAYNFAANEVVDTTRRLADISAALGVPMERLTYNLGQIKAQGVLNARDARDFANAGLAIVPMLAKMYTEQKRFGDELVTTAKVYDLMSKKMVSYGDVLAVINKLTDEGGKFYDYQAKQAETLKVQFANLTLAMNNMYNEIGQQEQGMITNVVKGLRYLFKNWQSIATAIKSVLTTLAIFKATQILALLTSARLWRIAAVSVVRFYNSVRYANGALAAFRALMASSGMGVLLTVVGSLASYFLFFRDSAKKADIQLDMFGETGKNTINKLDRLKKILNATTEGTSTFNKALSELNTTMSEYGINEAKTRDEVNSKIKQTIELVKLEAAERQHANMLTTGEEQYVQKSNEYSSEFLKSLQKSSNKELKNNALAVSSIIEGMIQDSIDHLAKYEGNAFRVEFIKVKEDIQRRLRGIGLNAAAEAFKRDNKGGFDSDALWKYAYNLKEARKEYEAFVKLADENYKKAQENIDASMTFNQKVRANKKALHDNYLEANSLYNKIIDLVKIAQKNYNINFDITATAKNFPKWMLRKSSTELRKLAETFMSFAESSKLNKFDINGELMTRAQVLERATQYAAAAVQKQSEEERHKDKKDNNEKTDKILKALKDEISLVEKLQSDYEKLTKAGATSKDALDTVKSTYEGTIDMLNKQMKGWGLPQLDFGIITGKNPMQQLEFFKQVLSALKGGGLENLERIKALEGVIERLNVKVKEYNLDMVTKGLNNELGKLKEEYELAMEFEANPELGEMFADMMGLSKEQLNELPRNFESVVRKLQSFIDSQLGFGTFDVRENLNKKTFEQWLKTNQVDLGSQKGQLLKAYVDYANKIREEETKKQIEDWNKLLEKYSEYEYKRLQIEREYQREMETARKKGADSSIISAIERRREKSLADVNMSEFQQSQLWITATGDLAGLTDKALGLLIDRIEEFKKSEKNLDAKQIKQLNNALKQLYSQQRRGNPFLALSNAIKENRNRRKEWEKQLDDDGKALDEQNKRIEKGVHLTEKETQQRQKLIERIKQTKEMLKNLKDATPEQIVESISTITSTASTAVGAITDMMKAFGNDEAVEVISGVMGALEKAASFALTGAAIGGKIGAVIGGVFGLVTGLVSSLADILSGNRAITKQVEKSQRSVKALENAYKKLEAAIENAYGAEKYGSEQAAIANKRLQLAELKRQLQLERSRQSKYVDIDKIQQLEGEIIDLEKEIKDAVDGITKDLLGISSVGDAAEEMVLSMIDAFKKGENYMAVFDESFDKMIDNMIMKSIVSRVIGDRMQEIFDAVSERATSRADAEKTKLDTIARQKKKAEDNLAELEKTGIGGWFETGNREVFLTKDLYNRLHSQLEEIIKEREEAEKNAAQAYADAIRPTDTDVNALRDKISGIRGDVEEEFKAWMDVFGLKFGESAEAEKLSNLQQGIQNITENTAGAIEAYLNGVSQQVYLHSDLLTQIRDAVVGFDMDVQLATQAQILMQLQASYQVQMSIQSMLQGWSSPNGMAVRVEMV